MNYKLLFPTYRTRFLYLETTLDRLRENGKLGRTLHIGSGEGDYDRLIRSAVESLVAGDINQEDVEFARRLNEDLPDIEYKTFDALALPFESRSFELVIAIDVLEHVASADQMMQEVSRVLRPGGTAIISFPSLHFPVTYDPINRVLARFGTHISLGAYAFGHDKLIDPEWFQQLARQHGLQTQEATYLTKALAALIELYWPGVLQRFMKANATNQQTRTSQAFSLRPSNSAPPFQFLVDAIIRLDAKLLAHSRSSVGAAFVLNKAVSAR